MIYCQQLDISDCGAACLTMVASHYGKHLNLAQVRCVAGTDVIGTNINGIVVAASYFGFTARPVKGTKSEMNITLSTPLIAHVKISNGSNSLTDHFIVVRKVFNSKVEIWDPNPLVKKKKISLDEFLSMWSGYAIFLEPGDSFKTNKKNTGLILRFLPVFLPHKKILIHSLLASLMLMFFGLIISFVYKYVFDEIILSKANLSLSTLSIILVSIIILQSIVALIREILLSHFSFKTDLQLNLSYLTHVLKLPLSFFESRKSGEILSRLGDLDTVKQTISNTFLSGTMDILMILISGPILFHINASLFFIALFSIILLSICAYLFSIIYRRFYSKIMSENADVHSYLVELMNGISTIKSLNAEQIVNDEYEKRKMKAVATSWNINNYSIYQGFISGLISGISSILVFTAGSFNIIKDVITFGTLITFNTLLGYFSGPLFRLVNFQNEFQEAVIAAKRVGEILELDREQIDEHHFLIKEGIMGDIKICNITFRYGSRLPIYENLTLDIPTGSWTALVGPSGCGKTTLVKLLLNLYKPESGEILYNSINIQDIDSYYLRSKIGYVPQDVFLFSGTVLDNIKIHKPTASLNEVIDVAKKSGASEFIDALPNRYHTQLGEHGGGLSGGEKQKLALARALLGNPKMIILDEATSSLDINSERSIHAILQTLRSENITVIIIAHRLSTVKNCDIIYVLDKGKIIEKGTHQYLYNKKGFYYSMWQGLSQ